MHHIRKIKKYWLRQPGPWGLLQRWQPDCYGLSRSVLGWLSIRFEGGPSYPEMINQLKIARQRYGHLIQIGETVRGDEWIERIQLVDPAPDAHLIHAIRTLLPCPRCPL